MSFSSYLEKVRMRHACDLLGQAEVTIDAVASQSGYGSAHSFRRAFKRVMGVLPSEYRDLLLNPTAVAR
jgi:two-component system response regulator YesN